MEKVKELQKARQEAADLGDVWTLQAINYELARLARKLKLNYYSL